MQIEIKPLIGLCRGVETDAGVDVITADGREIAVVGRQPGAPLQLITNGVAPATVKAARKALDERDSKHLDDDLKPIAAARFQDRETQEPPLIEEEEESGKKKR